MLRSLARLSPEPFDGRFFNTAFHGDLFSPAGPLARAIRQTKNCAVDSKGSGDRQEGFGEIF
jgi:hypothetical protein